jgi:hypothetical protein
MLRFKSPFYETFDWGWRKRVAIGLMHLASVLDATLYFVSLTLLEGNTRGFILFVLRIDRWFRPHENDQRNK